MTRCENCYYSELIDGTLYCHFQEEDVLFNQTCESFVNYERLKDIIEDVKDHLRIGGKYG